MAGDHPPRPLMTVPSVTHTSRARVPIGYYPSYGTKVWGKSQTFVGIYRRNVVNNVHTFVEFKIKLILQFPRQICRLAASETSHLSAFDWSALINLQNAIRSIKRVWYFKHDLFSQQQQNASILDVTPHQWTAKLQKIPIINGLSRNDSDYWFITLCALWC